MPPWVAPVALSKQSAPTRYTEFRWPVSVGSMLDISTLAPTTVRGDRIEGCQKLERSTADYPSSHVESLGRVATNSETSYRQPIEIT